MMTDRRDSIFAVTTSFIMDYAEKRSRLQPIVGLVRILQCTTRTVIKVAESLWPIDKEVLEKGWSCQDVFGNRERCCVKFSKKVSSALSSSLRA